MAAIQDLVLTFCPKLHCTPQRKLKLLMPVWEGDKESNFRLRQIETLWRMMHETNGKNCVRETLERHATHI